MHTFIFAATTILATLSHNCHLFKCNQIKTKSIQHVWNPKLLSNYSEQQHYILVACQYWYLTVIIIVVIVIITKSW